MAAELAVVVPFLIARGAFAPGADFDGIARRLGSDGLVLGIAEMVAAPVVLGLVAAMVWLRKGPTLRDYLALHPVPRPVLLRWLLATVALAAVFDLSAWAAGLATVTDWMLDIVRTAGFLPLLVLALVVLAPVLEEIVFRGFVFEGLRRSWIGDAGAVVFAAVVWGLTHLQYGWFYIAQIVAAGVLLGAARIRTGSVVTPILMHVIMNVAATLQAILQTSRPADP
jgi:membrane protease YdiL (CAAX protease family)